MNDTRPKNLNLFTIHFPVPAIVSILHRVSGAFLFLLVPFIIWGLSFSLTPSGFETLQRWFDNLYLKIFLWLLLIPFCFHVVAGIRHLLMDIHIGESLEGGRMTGIITFIVTLLLVVLVGVWLW